MSAWAGIERLLEEYREALIERDIPYIIACEDQFRALAAQPVPAPAPLTFPDESYAFPLVQRLEAAAQDGPSVPRLGIFGDDKHTVPLTTAEARELLALIAPRETPTPDVASPAVTDAEAEHFARGILDAGKVNSVTICVLLEAFLAARRPASAPEHTP